MKTKFHIGVLKRICALVLCTAILIGIMPQISFDKAEAANTTQAEALNKLVEWGIMRGDQAGNLSPERAITRAEFVTMLNRTFGYTKTSSQPFKDVKSSDWFYDDIRIAYNAGYFSGTSKNTASPYSNLTREAAVVMLCRNIMLKEQSGEDLSFTDSRLASDWSRGYIKSAAEKGIVAGDTSGTFRPLANITRGEVAILLARIIGTPVLDTGTYSNNVSGNLMINKSGVTLDNMTVTGDLYITGGVGLGYVTLNNVHVYGQIIASGAGESNKGDCSIIIKNSSAPEMIVDSPSNQYVTVRTTGTTVIDKTYVRTDTYLEDKSNEGYGMTYIEIDGEAETKLDLSGNINEVVSVTPESAINVGSGIVKTLTIDENATNSTVKIDQGAIVETLNLDVATTVTGKGDISSLYVNAPGCKVEMLPDYIYIRPGITANINGTEMDSTLAQQMSDMPRILTGYPRSDDIAPTQMTAKFETNKEGTVYWAVRLSGDGAMVAEDIITPPSYGAKIVKSGKVSAKEANTVIQAKISGLKLDTSYVLSAVLVDERGTNSLVKTLYFTTPDNSKPNFASGYPKTSLIEDTYVVFDVAASKNCTLYWAIYKKGMTAPIANDFKDNVLTGSIDSGTVKMTKSEEESITMGNILANASNALKEYTDYDVYFFLSDGINDSTIKKVTVTTADRTPPEFLTNYPRISKIEAKKLTGEAAINEDGKVYWALVKRGTDYPVPDPALDPNNPNDAEKLELYYKNQIKGGMYALKSGSVSTNEDAIKSISFSGLEAETAYDIYFVAEDEHGNLSEIKIITNAKTLDSSAPKLIEQKFSLANDKGVPLADTDVTLVFDEDIYNQRNSKSLYEMFNETDNITTTILTTSDKKNFSLADLIKEMFVLRNLDIPDSTQQVVPIELGTTDFKDYINVRLTEDGYTEVTFKSKALNLLSGTTYQFTLNQIKDSSNNLMPANTLADEFRTLDAQIDLNETTTISIPSADVGTSQDVSVDTSFSMIPYANSTQNASKEARYDVLIASDTTISFEVYRRERKSGSKWEVVKNSKDNNTTFSITHTSGDWTALSLNYAEGLTSDTYKHVVDFPEEGFEYAIKLKSINLIPDSDKWNATVNLKIFCISGSPLALNNLSQGGSVSAADLNNAISSQEVSSIGNPTDFNLKIVRVNQSAPQFKQQYPQAQAGDSITKINFMLDREGELYYVVAPENRLKPTYEDGYGSDADPSDYGNKNDSAEFDIGTTDASILEKKLLGKERNHHIVTPSTQNIMNPSSYSTADGYRSDKIEYSGTGLASFTVEDLEPNSKYYIYFVLKGSYKDPSSVMVYTFETGDVYSPVLKAYANGSSATYTIEPEKGQPAISANTYWKLYPYNKYSYPELFDTQITIGSEKKTYIEAIRDGTIHNASPSDKQRLWDLLSAPQSGNPAPSQSGVKPMSATSTEPATNNVVNPDELIINTNYIMFVAAKNELGGEPVFAMVEGISKHDNEGPKISNISTSTYKIGNDTINTSVTIEFNSEIYLRKTNTSPPETKYYKSFSSFANDITYQSPLPGATAEITKVTTSSITVLIQNSIEEINFRIEPDQLDYEPYICSETGVARSAISIKIIKDKDEKFKAVINGGVYDGLTSELDE